MRLGDVVRSVSRLRPTVTAKSMGAALALAAYAASMPAMANESPAFAAYKAALTRISTMACHDPSACAKDMKDFAKRSLLDAKAKGLDVNASDDPAPRETDRLRQRLRGALYVDVAAMDAKDATARVRGIASDALAAGRPAGAPTRSATLDDRATPKVTAAVRSGTTSTRTATPDDHATRTAAARTVAAPITAAQTVAVSPAAKPVPKVKEKPDSDDAFYRRMASAEKAEKRIGAIQRAEAKVAERDALHGHETIHEADASPVAFGR